MRSRFLAFLLVIPFGLSSVAFAENDARQSDNTVAGGSDVLHHLNSFAIIFGRCVWIPPSPQAALAGLSLFFGIGIRTAADTATAEAMIASQYVAAGKSLSEADKEIAWINSCFATYEVPPENRSHSDRSGGAVTTGPGANR